MESETSIPQRIYRIRGQQVMLDEDLAMLYGVPTKRLNEQVRRPPLQHGGLPAMVQWRAEYSAFSS